MSRLLYYLLLKPLSLLPYSVLYGLSDLLYLILYKMVGYRVKVIRHNIARSFPEKSTQERRKIESDFYCHFMDLMMETVKLFSITSEELLDRCRILNPEVFEPWVEKHPRIIICSGHYGNWEMAAQAYNLACCYVPMGIYTPIKDPFLDEKMRLSRGKFGMVLVSRKEVAMAFHKPPTQPEAYLWATDQSPSNASKAYWTTFLNQETPIFFGAEKFAVDFDCPVFFIHYAKPKRGYYEITFEVLVPSPTTTSYGDITDAHTRILEQHIIETPHLWLWSHRRWKKVRPPDVPLHPPKQLKALQAIHSAPFPPTSDAFYIRGGTSNLSN